MTDRGLLGRGLANFPVATPEVNCIQVRRTNLISDSQCGALQEFLQRLKTVLRQFPPPQPTTAAVDLLVAVGDQQLYLSTNKLLPPPDSDGSLDALQVGKLSSISHSLRAGLVQGADSELACNVLRHKNSFSVLVGSAWIMLSWLVRGCKR